MAAPEGTRVGSAAAAAAAAARAAKAAKAARWVRAAARVARAVAAMAGSLATDTWAAAAWARGNVAHSRGNLCPSCSTRSTRSRVRRRRKSRPWRNCTSHGTCSRAAGMVVVAKAEDGPVTAEAVVCPAATVVRVAAEAEETSKAPARRAAARRPRAARSLALPSCAASARLGDLQPGQSPRPLSPKSLGGGSMSVLFSKWSIQLNFRCKRERCSRWQALRNRRIKKSCVRFRD